MANGSKRAAESTRSPLERLTVEALERLATPELAERLIDEALAAAGLADVPADTPSFGSFACGALRLVVEEALGAEAAEAVLQDLEPAFLRRGLPHSGVRKRGRESLTAPAAPERVVVIASSRRDLVERLRGGFGDETKVVAAYDVFGVLQSAQRYPDRPLLLLLDDEMEAIRPSSLATLARVLPPGTRVIQFGRQRVEPERRGSEPPPSLEWRRLGEAAAHHVLQACEELLGPLGSDPSTPASGARLEVVLGHRDALVREAIAERLRRAGHTVREAASGVEVLERCLKELPQVVVVAERLVGIEGRHLASLVQLRFGGQAPRVVLLGPARLGSTCDVPEGAERVLEEGDVDGLLAALAEA